MRRRRRVAVASVVIIVLAFLIVVIILPFPAGDASRLQPLRHGRVVAELLPELSDVDAEVAG